MIDSTLFVGVGSPHGDDQVGWLVARALADMSPKNCEVRLHFQRFRRRKSRSKRLCDEARQSIRDKNPEGLMVLRDSTVATYKTSWFSA